MARGVGDEELSTRLVDQGRRLSCSQPGGPALPPLRFLAAACRKMQKAAAEMPVR